MKNFLIGLVAGVLVCGLILLILVVAAFRFAGSSLASRAARGEKGPREGGDSSCRD